MCLDCEIGNKNGVNYVIRLAQKNYAKFMCYYVCMRKLCDVFDFKKSPKSHRIKAATAMF